MAYSTLAQIKAWLQGITTTAYDTELTATQTAVSYHIDNALRQYTDLPVQTQLINELADIEAEMVAAQFYQRRQTNRDHGNQMLKEAADRLIKFIDARFKTSIGISNA